MNASFAADISSAGAELLRRLRSRTLGSPVCCSLLWRCPLRGFRALLNVLLFTGLCAYRPAHAPGLKPWPHNPAQSLTVRARGQPNALFFPIPAAYTVAKLSCRSFEGDYCPRGHTSQEYSSNIIRNRSSLGRALSVRTINPGYERWVKRA